MSVVGATVEVFVLLVVARLFVEVFGRAVEFVSTEMRASVNVILLGPAPNVKREPAPREINIC